MSAVEEGRAPKQTDSLGLYSKLVCKFHKKGRTLLPEEGRRDTWQSKPGGVYTKILSTNIDVLKKGLYWKPGGTLLLLSVCSKFQCSHLRPPLASTLSVIRHGEFCSFSTSCFFMSHVIIFVSYPLPLLPSFSFFFARFFSSKYWSALNPEPSSLFKFLNEWSKES